MRHLHTWKHTRGLRIWPVFFVFIILSVYICLPLTVFGEEFDCATGKHDYVITTKKATENKDGEKIFTCRICGYTFTRVLPATGHTWSEWIIDMSPSCTELGHKHRICTRHENDPHSEEETIPKLGHIYKETVTPPTCKKDGFKTYTCERCGDTYTKPFGDKALGHHYIESITKEPDCEIKGEKTYTCERCGHTYTKSIPALGHSFGQWITDKEATEEEEGHRYKVCEHNSHHIIEETIAKLPPHVIAQPFISTDDPSPTFFPNRMDIFMLSVIPAMVAGFVIAIYRDICIVRWDKKKRIPFKEWWKMYNK